MSDYDPYFPVFSPERTGTSRLAGIQKPSADPDQWNLYEAVSRNRLDVVQRILSSPARHDFQEIAGALRLAGQRGYTDVARFLLSRTRVQVDVHCPDGYTALILAARLGHEETLQMLIDQGADPSRAVYRTRISALHWAAGNGHLGSVEILLKAGASANALTLQHRTPLMLAACYGYVEVMRRLIRVSDNISFADVYQMTALHMAVKEGYGRAVDLLVDEGADLDAQNQKGYTPLLLAIDHGHSEIAFRLIRSEANLEKTLDGCLCRAIHMAIALERVDICKYLIEAGCSLTAPCELIQTCCGSALITGQITPLHVVATGRDVEIFSLILDKLEEKQQLTKSFMFASTLHGYSPLMLAAAFGSSSVLTELLKRCEKFVLDDDFLSELSLAALCSILRRRVYSLATLLQMCGSRLPAPRIFLDDDDFANNRSLRHRSRLTVEILNELCPEREVPESVINVLFSAGNCEALLQALVHLLPSDLATVNHIANQFAYPSRLEQMCISVIRRTLGPLFLTKKASTLWLPPVLLKTIILGAYDN